MLGPVVVGRSAGITHLGREHIGLGAGLCLGLAKSFDLLGQLAQGFEATGFFAQPVKFVGQLLELRADSPALLGQGLDFFAEGFDLLGTHHVRTQAELNVSFVCHCIT